MTSVTLVDADNVRLPTPPGTAPIERSAVKEPRQGQPTRPALVSGNRAEPAEIAGRR